MKQRGISAASVDVSGLIAPFDKRLEAIESSLAQTNALLERLVGLMETSSRSWSGPRRDASGTYEEPRSKLTLHAAISQVLREAGEPLSTREIAERVRNARLYVPPRSDNPLSAAQVGSRLYHPLYRHEFKRTNGRVTLARKNREVSRAVDA